VVATAREHPLVRIVSVTTDVEDGIYHEGQSVKIKVVLQGFSESIEDVSKMELRFAVSDYYGNQTAQTKKHIIMTPWWYHSFKLSFKIEKRGVFMLTLYAKSNGGEEAKQADLTTFAVVPCVLAKRWAPWGWLKAPADTRSERERKLSP